MNRRTFSLLFFVKRTKHLSHGEVPVYLRITVDGKRAEFSIKRSIQESNWDPKRTKAKGKSKTSIELNSYIDSIRMQIYRHQKELEEAQKEVTAESLKNAYHGTVNEFTGLIHLFEDHNKKMYESVQAGKNAFASSTYERYKHSIKILRNFVVFKYSKTDLAFGEVNYQFLLDYEHYLKTKRGCAHNSAMKRMRELKKIIRLGVKLDLIKKNPFDSYTITYDNTEREILNEQDLNKLRSSGIKSRRLSIIRDLFIFQCYTGISYVDLFQLKPENFNKNEDGRICLRFNRGKTNTFCKLPLIKPAEEIYTKYQKEPRKGGKLFPVPSNQRYNACLKEVAIECGISKALTSHMARHTFATTVTLSNGISIETVGKMLGHRKISTTQIYAKVLDEKVFDEMSILDLKIGNERRNISESGETARKTRDSNNFSD